MGMRAPAQGSGAGGCQGSKIAPHKALQLLCFPEGEGALPLQCRHLS